MVSAFRNGVNYLTDNGQSYFPVVTEGQGAFNILSGVSQIGIGHAMTWSSQEYYNRIQSGKYILRGNKTLLTGIYQFLPGTLAISPFAVTAYFGLKYFPQRN